jgi:hypothetical protein
MSDDDDDYDDDIDWIKRATNLLSDEYLPIPSIRMVILRPSPHSVNTYIHEVREIDRSEFSTFAIPTTDSLIIRDIALFSFDIQKHQISMAGSGTIIYESMNSIEHVRERLCNISAFPCFFHLFEILVVLDEINKPASAMKRSNGKTRKSVRFHHSCTRRV